MIPKWLEGLKTLCKCRHDPSKTGLTWGVFLSPDNLEDAVLRLFQAGFFLEDISGLDTTDGFAAVYHLSDYTGFDRVALYVIVSHEDPFHSFHQRGLQRRFMARTGNKRFFRHWFYRSPGPKASFVA